MNLSFEDDLLKIKYYELIKNNTVTEFPEYPDNYNFYLQNSNSNLEFLIINGLSKFILTILEIYKETVIKNFIDSFNLVKIMKKYYSMIS